MNRQAVIFLCSTIIVLTGMVGTLSSKADTPPSQFYNYANSDAEYSVLLPEAPTARTIWADEGNVPYLDHPPEVGALGEVATFKRTDIKTGEIFNVKITFLKIDPDSLAELTEKKIKAALEKDLREVDNISNVTYGFSPGKETLKWAVMSGYAPDEKGRPLYYVENYLTGLRSFEVIQVEYNVDNKAFSEFYKKLSSGIQLIKE